MTEAKPISTGRKKQSVNLKISREYPVHITKWKSNKEKCTIPQWSVGDHQTC